MSLPMAGEVGLDQFSSSLLNFTQPPQPPHSSAPSCHPALHPSHAVGPHLCAIPESLLLLLVLSEGFLRLSLPHHRLHVWLLSFLCWSTGIFSSTLSHPKEYHWECKRDRLLAPISGAWPCFRLWKSAAEIAWKDLIDLRLKPAQGGWNLQGFDC